MIASAVVARPKLLMLDEPASGLTSDEQADVADISSYGCATAAFRSS